MICCSGSGSRGTIDVGGDVGGVVGGDDGPRSGGIVSTGVVVGTGPDGAVVVVVVVGRVVAVVVDDVDVVADEVVGVDETTVAAAAELLSTLSRTPNTALRRACWSRATSPQSAPSCRNPNAVVHRFTKSPSPPSAIDAPTTVSPTDRVGSTSVGPNACSSRKDGTTLVRNATSDVATASSAVSAFDRRSSCDPRSMASPRYRTSHGSGWLRSYTSGTACTGNAPVSLTAA
jgi:hypothetical protein